MEIRDFGSPVYTHCLPVNRNYTFIQSTTNITYIHIQNRQVICGGPRYQSVCDRIGTAILAIAPFIGTRTTRTLLTH